jgi:hypothetical protein
VPACQHSRQNRSGAEERSAQVRFHVSPPFLRLDLPNGPDGTGKTSIVDKDIYGSQFAGGALRHAVNSLGIGYVCHDCYRPTSGAGNKLGGLLELIVRAANRRNNSTRVSKSQCHGAPNSAAGTGY